MRWSRCEKSCFCRSRWRVWEAEIRLNKFIPIRQDSYWLGCHYWMCTESGAQLAHNHWRIGGYRGSSRLIVFSNRHLRSSCFMFIFTFWEHKCIFIVCWLIRIGTDHHVNLLHSYICITHSGSIFSKENQVDHQYSISRHANKTCLYLLWPSRCSSIEEQLIFQKLVNTSDNDTGLHLRPQNANSKMADTASNIVKYQIQLFDTWVQSVWVENQHCSPGLSLTLPTPGQWKPHTNLTSKEINHLVWFWTSSAQAQWGKHWLCRSMNRLQEIGALLVWPDRFDSPKSGWCHIVSLNIELA